MIICTNKNQNHKINVQNKDHIDMKQQVNSNFNSKEYKLIHDRRKSIKKIQNTNYFRHLNN